MGTPERTDPPVPEITEQIHLPGPSYLPAAVALGLTMAIVGVVLSWIAFGIGVVLFLAATVRWIRDTRADIADLPLEHGH